MPTVLLVRHAQGSYGGADYDVLSETGHRQAAVLAADLRRRGLTPDRVVSGGLHRQRDTATALLPAGAELVVDPAWDEYDAGDVLEHHSRAGARLETTDGSGPALSSRDFQVIMDEALLEWVQAGAASTTAEPHPAFAARCRAALDCVTAALGPGETAFVCTSGGVIAALAADLLDAGARALVPLNRVAVNTAVSRLAHGSRGTTLLSFNEYGHLDGEPGLRTGR